MEWGYLLILIGSVFMCGMTASRKEYQRKVDATLLSTVVFMGVSSLFVCLIGVVYSCFNGFELITKADNFVILLGLLFAFILTVNTCLCIFGAKYGSLAMITTFATLGTLVISTVFGLITDPIKNHLSVYSIIGLSLAVVIIALGFISNKGLKSQEDSKNSKLFILICIAIFIFNGSALSVYSVFTSNRASYGGFNFIFLYLFFCVILCGLTILALFLHSKKTKKSLAIKDCVVGKPLVCSLIYGVIFFCAEFCALTTTSILPIVIQAPLSFAMNVVIVAIVDYLIYKQKLSKIQLIQIALAILSGVCFAL